MVWFNLNKCLKKIRKAWRMSTHMWLVGSELSISLLSLHTAAKGHLVFKISFDSNTEMGTNYIITSPLKESNDLLLMKTLFLIFAYF